MNVADWLHGLGLAHYEQAFRKNDIDAEVLLDLTEEDLVGLGIESIGHRRKLLAAIAQLRAASPPQTATSRLRAVSTSGDLAPLPDAERRQVTVLFVDISGYTKLAEELDAEEVHNLLDRFFDVADASIADYGGTVDKHIGDCVMAVFGAPLAHEDDPERCVRAALDIRRRLPMLAAELGRPIGAHIGIASGEVVASGTGSARHREYTVTGDSVNLASRLTDLAAADEILISDTVRRALLDRLDCVEVGELAIRGHLGPVKAWRLLGLRDPSRSARQRFVGRRQELHQLESILADCLRSGRGQTVYIRGEAGIGKTRLLEEIQAAAARMGFAAHSGLVLSFGMGAEQDAIRSLVRSVLDLSATSAQDEREAATQRTIESGLLSADRCVYLNDLLNIQQPRELRSLYDAMDSAVRNRGKRETVAELVARVSQERRRLLAIEDLHWADRGTLDYLADLAAAIVDIPAVLVMTSRIEGDPLDETWLQAPERAPPVVIDVGPLLPAEADTLASSYLSALGTLAQRCIERAAGNPLFLEQLLRHAEESSDEGVPGSIRSLVQARLDVLDPADKQALQAASVLGQRFTEDALRALTEQPNYDCEPLIRHLLVRKRGESFLFAHALIQEGVYDTLLKKRRRELHRRAAALFDVRDPTLRAEHLDRAEDAEAPRAYLDAARTQAAEYHTERSLRLVDRGLALATSRKDTCHLSLFRAELLHDLGSIPESTAAYERALSVAESELDRCRAWFGLASVMRVTDRFDDAFALLDKAAAVASSEGLAVESARIHHLRGNLFFPLGKLAECLHEHQMALESARAAGSPQLEARALGGLGDAEYARGRMASAHRGFSRCVDVARASGSGRIEVANLSMVAHTQVYLNDFSGALATCQSAVELAARVGHHRAEIIAHNAACCTYRTTAEFVRAQPHASRALALAQQLGARRFESIALQDLAMVARAASATAEALKLICKALEISRETGLSFAGPWILAHLAVTTDDPSERREALAEGEAILRKGAVSHNHLWFFRYAIDAALSDHDWDAAERYAASLDDYTRPEPLPWASFFIRCGRALAAHGRGGPSQESAAELEALAHETPRLGLAGAFEQFGRRSAHAFAQR